MTIALKSVALRQTIVKTRMPFRYGIATLTEVPYLFVCGEFDVDGELRCGVSADVLPPKWFTKQPGAQLSEEIEEMKLVIRQACKLAIDIAQHTSVFAWWRELYQLQMQNRELQSQPPLLKGFGVSLLERAAIDAYCRRHQLPFAIAIRENRLGVDLGTIHRELQESKPANWLPSEPSQEIHVRHTIGLSDPLESIDVPAAERLADGLPQSLAECVQHYGLTHFKIKLPPHVDESRERLRAIAVLLAHGGWPYKFTLDGNEFFEDAAAFREYWNDLNADTVVANFVDRGLLVVEQPLHRDVALSTEVGEIFADWQDRPPLIIDESDGQLDSFSTALEVGYHGTSHKNCKGVFKGIANACLVNARNKRNGGPGLVTTGEDLMNLGPVALLQDLAVAATLGLTHVERNGHHYVAGLSPFPESIQDSVLSSHRDLYRLHESRPKVTWPSLDVKDGQIQLGSIVDAPFGYAMNLPLSDLDPTE